jgi:hypothetical protein
MVFPDLAKNKNRLATLSKSGEFNLKMLLFGKGLLGDILYFIKSENAIALLLL